MDLTDVRRLTGVNFLHDRCGAIAEAVVEDDRKGVAVCLWRERMRSLLDAVGWNDEEIVVRCYPGGASLMTTAPIDGLFVAADMIEFAWSQVVSDIEGLPHTDPASEIEGFRQEIAETRNPNLILIAEEAEERGVSYLGGDGTVSLGLGKNAKVWPEEELPTHDAIDWDEIGDIPVAMVTGTNGKSTTVRITAALCSAAGHVTSLSSSDWVRVGDEILDEGDYSGPAGARLAVRDPRVEMAVIETARGGLMRRGLPVPRADACLITNIAADHLGSYGITDVPTLADAKFLLSRAIKPGGRLILNADDPFLVDRGPRFGGALTWYGLSFNDRVLSAWLRDGQHAAFMRDEMLFYACDGKEHEILSVVDFEPAMRGAARYNISNALGAISLAVALGIPFDAISKGLTSFKTTPEENPGRGNLLEVGGATVLIDFAHNPAGVLALAEAVKSIPTKRRLFLLGHAGDRSDDDIRDTVRAVCSSEPDMTIVKELPKHLRGRNAGEVTALCLEELKRLNVPDTSVMTAEDEIQSVHKALEWANPGDLLVLLLHEDRKEAMALLDILRTSKWQAGDPLPV